MSEKSKVAEEKIKYDGIFDFKETYSFIYTILSDWEYSIAEKEYSEKAKGDSKEIEIKWEASRKVTDYFKYQMKVEWRILGMKDVEVVKDGKKSKKNSGTLEIKFVSVLIKDYQDKWSDTPFLKFLRGVYDKFVISDAIGEQEGKLEGEMSEAVNQTKAFLVLESRK